MHHKSSFFTVVGLISVNSLFGYAYTVTDLGVPLGYAQSTAVDITNAGVIAVNGLNAPLLSDGFLYQTGSYTPVPNLGPTVRSLIYSINESAQVVGTEWSLGNSPTGFYYNPNTAVLAERAFSLSGSDYARVINDSGMILGGATDWGAGSWIYSSGYFDVDSSVPALSLAYDINNNGTMLAYNGTLGGYYTWDATNPGPAAPSLETSSIMTQINDFGILAGNSAGNLLLANSNLGGWGTAPVTNAGSLGTGVADVMDINDAGYVVGSFNYVSGAKGAYLYDGMALLDLNTLIDPSLGWTLSTANGLNDLGQIVGAGFNARGEYHAYLLTPDTPVPEPSTYGLMGAAALGLVVYLRRRNKR
jgi:uncharacterized membrane protein